MLLATFALLGTAPLTVEASGGAESNWVIDGFTTPYRNVAVAAAEMGIVAQVEVEEGQTVKVGQVLATLDQAQYRAQLAVAKQHRDAQGPIDAARAELDLRRGRLRGLLELQAEGFARSEEIERAEADVAMGEADLKTELEQHEIRKLEYERLKVQMQRRVIRARHDGVITTIHKRAGEFVAPNDPVVVTLVQLDPLYLPLAIPQEKLNGFREGRTLTVRFASSNEETEAVVDFISPETHAESGTVAVRIRIPNPDGKFRSGDRCVLDLSRVSK